RNIEQDSLSIRGDVIIDHARAKYSQGRPIDEKTLRVTHFQTFPSFIDLDGHHLVSAAHKVEFPAVSPPSRPTPSLRRYLPLSSTALERHHVDLRPCNGGYKRHPFSVRRKLPARL